jgi:hypothetical protein
MAQYTTKLGKRDLKTLHLTREEAEEMYRAGFRFSIYSPETEEFQVSTPFKMLQNLDCGTVTLMQ